ncbi:hypothetical protein KKC1_03660 [Calderihabitans maritimus]|uniref:Uncharacterized protein n=1 Tax=Calderihabitans maritimus TaxID=1246530 RepID=A0A1Z5HNW4_9FIRM|nr:hypothetical protein KKC1_03660 [Calderihabitans maritimus]
MSQETCLFADSRLRMMVKSSTFGLRTIFFKNQRRDVNVAINECPEGDSHA